MATLPTPRPKLLWPHRTDMRVTVEGARYHVPLSKLRPGQSIFIPTRRASELADMVNTYDEYIGWRYIAKAVVEEKVFGVRIWRKPG